MFAWWLLRVDYALCMLHICSMFARSSKRGITQAFYSKMKRCRETKIGTIVSQRKRGESLFFISTNSTVTICVYILTCRSFDEWRRMKHDKSNRRANISSIRQKSWDCRIIMLALDTGSPFVSSSNLVLGIPRRFRASAQHCLTGEGYTE